MSGTLLETPSMKEALESEPIQEKDKLSDHLSLTCSQTPIDKQILERAEGVAIQVSIPPLFCRSD